MKNYHYFLFDWDGCLARTLEIWLDAYTQVFAEYGIYLKDKEITGKVFGDWKGPLKLGIKPEDLEEYTQKLLSIVNYKLEEVKLYPHALAVLQTLHNSGKKVAILTTSKKVSVQPAINRYGLGQYLDLLVTAEDVKHHKPDPEIIDTALNKLGGTKDLAIIIGDSKSDLGAATNAGIDSVLFYPSSHEVFYDIDTLKSYHPTNVIEDFSQLIDLVSLQK